MSLGDLVGQGFRTFRNNVKFFVSIFFWPSLLCSGCITGMKWCFLHWIRGQQAAPMTSADELVGFVYTLLFHLAGVLTFIIMAMWGQFVLAVRSVAVIRFALGFASNYEEALTQANRIRWTIFWVYNLAVILPFLVVGFFVSLSILTSLLFVGPLKGVYVLLYPALALEGGSLTFCFAWSVLWTSLAYCILACENLKMRQVIAKTNEMTKRYLWRGGSFVCLLCITLMLVSVCLALPVLGLAVFEARVGGPGGSSVLILIKETAEAVWFCLINILLMGVAFVGEGLYYRDVRLRMEGLDILKNLDDLATR